MAELQRRRQQLTEQLSQQLTEQLAHQQRQTQEIDAGNRLLQQMDLARAPQAAEYQALLQRQVVQHRELEHRRCVEQQRSVPGPRVGSLPQTFAPASDRRGPIDKTKVRDWLFICFSVHRQFASCLFFTGFFTGGNGSPTAARHGKRPEAT